MMRKFLIFLGATVVIAIQAATVYAVRTHGADRPKDLVVALDPEGLDASLTARCAGGHTAPDKAADACTTLIQHGGMAPVDEAAIYVNRGNALLRLRENVRALADFEHALTIYADSTAALFSRAVVREIFGEHRRALEDYTRVVALVPEHWRAYTRRGLVHQRLGETALAIADFDRALEISPEEPEPYARRSHSNRVLKRFDRALADAERAVAIRPEFALGYRQRGLLHLEREEF